jgi:amidase/aspartyl-tRNA(Asn)/glutamyl-tRNA(Gln) amidotransferase subunit A
MAEDDLAYSSASQLARRIRTKEISPVEVMDATIARIETRNPSLNALIFTDFDGARQAARAAEAAVMRGADLPPLHGVPAAIKDLFDFKPGWPTTFGGVRALKDNIAEFHCVFAERIEQGGAILVGKTNAPIMGFRGVTDNYLFGATRNPFDLSRNPGGSSGGSAAAVADGLLPLAEGTDAGGSIRIPAAWCNVYGYKASFGRVPVLVRPNAFAGDLPFIFEGPITRTVEDAALATSVLGGYDPRDPFSLDQDVDYLGALRRPIKGLRIGYSPNLDVFPIDPRVAVVVSNAVRRFEDAGAHVEEIRLGLAASQRELSDLWSRIMMPLNLGTLEATAAGGIDLLADHSGDFPPEFLRWIELGQKMTAADLRRDQEMRSQFYDAVQRAFESHDLLVTPTLACLPVKNAPGGNTLGPSEINGEAVDPLIGWCLTYPFNFTGHPAASIPAGLADGLPVGMQIVGRRYADVDVLAASAAFEQLQPWADAYAICRRRSTGHQSQTVETP